MRVCLRSICYQVVFPLGSMAAVIYMLSFASCGRSEPVYNVPEVYTSTPSTNSPAAPEPLVLSGPAEPLSSPLRIARSGSLLAVTDYSMSGIYILNTPTLAEKASFILNTPASLAWGDGEIFVGNMETGRIEVYSTSGLYLRAMDEPVPYPSDMAVDTSAKLLFVVDPVARAVRAFNTSGPLMHLIPKAGEAAPESPVALALDPTRSEVYVSDYGNVVTSVPASIKAYSYDGTFLYSIVSGSSGYSFARPQGLVADGAGHLIVVDAVLGQVLFFDTATKTGVKTLGSFGSGSGQLMLPMDIEMDPVSKDLYVTDNRNGRIMVFTGGGTVP